MRGTDDAELVFLAGVALFGGLDDSTIRSLADRLVERHFEAGDILWEQGDAAEEMIVVRRGELDVVDGDSGTVIARLGPGDCAGEMALLLDETRTATVRCRRRATVLSLRADDFDQVVHSEPTALVALARMLSRRLADRARPGPGTRIIATVADDGVPGATLVSRSLAELLPRRQGERTLLVRQGDGPTLDALVASDDQVPASVATGRAKVLNLDLSGSGERAAGDGLRILVDRAHNRYAAIVVDVPADAALSTAALADCCDALVEVTDQVPDRSGPRSPAPGARRVTVVNRRDASDPNPLSIDHVEPFVLPRDETLAGAASRSPVPYLRSTPNAPLVRVLSRLARSLTGTTVGLALGGGAAFGIAHVGILDALERAGIPVDVVAGTSMGSIVAIGAANGLTASDMIGIADGIGNVTTTLSALDPSLSGAGFLSGRRLVKIFEPFLRVQTFAQLEIPCRVVATDIETGERVELGSGDLVDAFRASCSIPVVFVPARVGGRTLVDGAMVEPVPAQVARSMGADVVIAVNVIPRPRAGVTTSLARFYRGLARTIPFGRSRRGLTDLLDVLMNSLQVVQHELGAYTALSADVQIDVDLADHTWIEFYRAREIIERGRSAGDAAIDAVHEAVASRLEHR